MRARSRLGTSRCGLDSRSRGVGVGHGELVASAHGEAECCLQGVFCNTVNAARLSHRLIVDKDWSIKFMLCYENEIETNFT